MVLEWEVLLKLTKLQWQEVLAGEYIGEIKYNDKIRVTYGANWHRGRGYKKSDKVHSGEVFAINEDGIHFWPDKRLSYRSIRTIERE